MLKLLNVLHFSLSLKRILPSQLPLSTKIFIYKSYVLSTLLYACEIWSPSLEDLSSLENFQKRCTKWLVPHGPYKDRLIKCKLLPISYLLQMRDLLMINKLVNDVYDFSINDHFNILYNENLRSSKQPLFIIKKTRSVKSGNNFLIRALKCANKLHISMPFNVFLIPCVFKYKLSESFYQLLINKYDEKFCKFAL